MSVEDPNRERLARVAGALGTELRSEVVFVGGATAGLLITDPAALAVRPTMDVDVIVEVASHAEYQGFLVPRLKAAGFRELIGPGIPLCAWQVAGVRVDVMPTRSDVLGFSNHWYGDAITNAALFDLEGMRIRVISAPYFVATKLVAFEDRGAGDYYGSHDLEDILTLVDGRPEILEDIARAPDDVRSYLASRASALLQEPDFLNALPGHVEAGRDAIVLGRLQAIVAPH